jgi:hypothetical protein
VVYYAGVASRQTECFIFKPTGALPLRDTHVIGEAIPLDRVLAKVETARELR